MTVWHDRKSLNLRAARSTTKFKAKPIGIAFHWEGVNQKQLGIETSREALRGIQRSHMNNKSEGYVDIAYNFAIDYLGNIFELRGWDVQGGANGTTKSNQEFISVCYLGGPTQPFTQEAKYAAESLRKEADARGIGSQNKPHSAFKATSCPGDEIRSFIATLSGGESSPSAQTPVTHTPAPSSTPAFPGTVKRGSKGDAVKKVQQRLKDRGWNISVDGDFGPATEKIVKQFQKEKNITDDGIAGPVTWDKLWTSSISQGEMMTQYNKFIVAIAGAIALAISETATDAKWASIALAFATSLGVFAVKNKEA